jgi:hypothetical protein
MKEPLAPLSSWRVDCKINSAHILNRFTRFYNQWFFTLQNFPYDQAIAKWQAKVWYILMHSWQQVLEVCILRSVDLGVHIIEKISMLCHKFYNRFLSIY